MSAPREPDVAFWDRLVDMPFEEALVELESRRVWCMDQRIAAVAARDVPREKSIDVLLTRLNAETKRINMIVNRLSWRQAVVAVLGEEAYVKVRAYMILNEVRRDPTVSGGGAEG